MKIGSTICASWPTKPISIISVSRLRLYKLEILCFKLEILSLQTRKNSKLRVYKLEVSSLQRLLFYQAGTPEKDGGRRG